MARPVIHHRTPEFSRTYAEVSRGAQELFGTEQPVLMMPASGTGGMEAAVTNTLSPGDRVCVVRGGKFGERWGEIATSYGLDPVFIDVEWGRPADPDDVTRVLAKHPDCRAVLIQHSETSTTALHPVGQIAGLVRDRDCLLIVDGITSVGVLDAPMDALGIDVLVTGSQKALMLPPGLALVALSARAWERQARATLPRYYFDLGRARKAWEDDTSSFTPAISLINGLAAVFGLVAANGGWPAVYERHAVLARAARAGMEAMGLCLLAPQAPSPAATGVWIPEEIDGARFTRYMRDAMGITIAGGQGHLKGRIFRLGHIGYVDVLDVLSGLAAIEMAMARFGRATQPGRGPAAAQEILQHTYEQP
jgi:aspartate aminotransferase-like enzyme